MRALIALAVSCITLVAVVRAYGDAATTERNWGERATVLVASKTIEPGIALDDSNTEQRRWPLALIPPDHQAAVRPRAVAGERIFEGSAIVAGQLISGSGRYPLTPAGQVAVAIPTGPAVVEAHPGDSVRLVARKSLAARNVATIDDPTELPDAQSTSTTPAGPESYFGLVVAADDEHLTIAMNSDDAIVIGQSVLSGSVAVMFDQVG